MKVMMFSKSDCELCEKAKVFFASLPMIPVEEVKLESQELRNQMYDRFGRTGKDRIMPQLVLIQDDGSELPLGGWKELQISGLPSLFPS